MAGQTTAVRPAHRAGDVRRLRRARTSSGPPGCATTSARINRALEKQAVVLGDGTDADVIALAEDPLEVAVQIFYVRGGRIRGQRGWVADRVDEGGTAELVEDFLLQLYAGDVGDVDPARDPGARAAAGRRRRSSSCSATCAAARVPIRVPQRGDKKALQETVARNAAQALGAAQDQAGQRPDHPQPGAGGDPGGARARRGAAAHRVLRRLQPPGHRGGRLDGGLRGRPGPQERVPPLRDQGRRRPERRRLDARGDHPAVPAAARRAGASPSSRARRRPTSGPMLVDPETGRPRKFAYAPGPGRRRRRPAAGRGRPAGARRARHRRHPGLRPGQAARGGVAARPGGPGDPAAHPEGLYLLQRIRDEAHRFAITHHRVAAVQVDGREPARRRPRAGRGAPQDPAQALRLAEEAARGRRSRRSPQVPGIGPATAAAIKDAVAPRAAATGRLSRVNTATGEIEEHERPTDADRASRGELVVVTGMTGAGRSTAAKELEDLGFFVVDNLPPSCSRDVVRLVDESRGAEQPIAVVVDVRSGVVLRRARRPTSRRAPPAGTPRWCSSRPPTRCWSAGRRPRGARTRCRAAAGCSTGCSREREVLADLRGDADLVIDTTGAQRAPAHRPDRRGVRHARDRSG